MLKFAYLCPVREPRFIDYRLLHYGSSRAALTVALGPGGYRNGSHKVDGLHDGYGSGLSFVTFLRLRNRSCGAEVCAIDLHHGYSF